MQLEAGKYYMTRDGRKVEAIGDDGTDQPILVAHSIGNLWHYRDGKVNIDNRDHDLIAEWPIPATTYQPDTATNYQPDTATELTAYDHLRKAAAMLILEGKDQAAYDIISTILDHE